MPTMNSAAANGAPYQVPPEPSRWPSIALAAAVHAGLLAFLYIGVSWQNTTPVQVEAEVWDMKTQSAAPPPPPPPEVVEPQLAPVPVPVPKVVQPPPPVEQPVAPKPPDIALEREKRKAEKRKELLEEKKLEEQKLAKELKEKQLADKKAQELADKKAQELADKKAAQKADDLARKLEEKKLAEKLKADKLAKAKEAAEDQKRLDKVRADEMRRITAGAGTSGEAAKSTASRVDTSYLAAINSKIKSSTSYAGSTEVPGKPEVVFKIEQLPSGEIISVRLVKSSGIPAFDDAVEKGILKSSPLPKNKNGTVLRTLEIAFAMKDLK
jgi:colicin import membrane protein